MFGGTTGGVAFDDVQFAAGRVAAGLRERIYNGTLAPGTVLSQASIAAEYGVSRIPVRDAL
ncbi:MAG TPA: GntR family transcriptional regulator, partial [Chloroflexota bacterium]|nr:GntR family transcriptional regulator [Chloroflexota bacterium]